MVLQCRYYLLNIFNILGWITKYFHSIQDYLKKDVWYNFAFLRSNIRLRQLTRRGWDGGSTTTLLNSFAGEINFWNFFTPDNFCSFLYKCHLPQPIWQLATLYNENWGKFGHVVFVQAIIVRKEKTSNSLAHPWDNFLHNCHSSPPLTLISPKANSSRKPFFSIKMVNFFVNTVISQHDKGTFHKRCLRVHDSYEAW